VSFFERQHAAKASSLRLVLLFVAAVVGIVLAVDVVVLFLARGQPASTLTGLLVAASVAMLLIITGGSVSKTLSLRSGGSALAQSLGAVAVDPTTTDPVLRRYANVVEEISLASGVPMPRLFVMPDEPGINAFAAGYTPADAAITVTGGALTQLNRDELQGVIGHEFSHVLNGDMRLNIRLIGLLNGILLLGLVGLRVLGSGAGSNRKNGAPILVIAFAMLILGFVGQLFAGMIKAAVGRQREWLADASSVQFTRNPQGLEGALKKIAGLPTGSTLTNARNAKEVSHMLFGEGSSRFSSLFATHPPLMERIAALDPTFRPEQVAALQRQWAADPPNGLAEDAALGLVGSRTAGPPPAAAPRSEPAQPRVAVQPGQISARVGSMSESDLARGQQLSSQIPDHFRQLASQASTAVPLVLAMALSDDPVIRQVQLGAVSDRLGDDVGKLAAELVGGVAAAPMLLRLPIVSLAIPLITARPREQLDALVGTLDDVATADGSISVFEYCLTRMIAGYIRDANDPSGRSKPGKASVPQVQQAAFTLLAVVAAAGNRDPGVAERAFDRAVQYLLPSARVAYRPPSNTWRRLDDVWEPLDSLDPSHKRRLVESIVVAVKDDGLLGVAEAELLRTTCGLLHCSMPTFVA
jgi:Zn-dependent protease with chaperone function